MLVTRTPDGILRSRPMAIADVDSAGRIWFLTQKQSGKVDEIVHDQQVNVALQAKLKFVSISGSANLIEDRQRIAELWSDAWRPWFPGGKDDRSLILLSVRGDEGEYWDNSGTSGIKYLIEAGKALLHRTTPDVEHDPAIHGKVQL
jgi:general stress protein 26